MLPARRSQPASPSSALLALLATAALSTTGVASAAAAAPGYDINRPEIRAFIEAEAGQRGLDALETGRLIGAARRQQSILDAMSRPAEKVLPWWQYRERFLTEQRIAEGAAFWIQHQGSVERAAQAHGVPAEYLIAIVGVETFYGRRAGNYRILDALATLAFDGPSRNEFFRKELAEFLVMARDGDLNPLQARGSYAGAMGAPQFMPSSFRSFAVDGNGDGRRDLSRDWDDVFASVANYLEVHGWQRGEPVLADASFDGEPAEDPASASLDLADTVGSLRARGFRFATTLGPAAPAMRVPADYVDGNRWRVGFRNFHVITRYNRSSRYAMAVHELAQAVAARVAARTGS